MTAASITPSHISRAYQSQAPRAAASGENSHKSAVSDGRRVEDAVEISSAGLLSSEVLSILTPIEINPQALQAKSAAFNADLGKRFQAAGINTDQPINLFTDFQGQVKLRGDHPDKAKIEALFANDAELSNQFRHLSAASTLHKAVEEHMAFAQDYEQNQQAAIARHAHLFSGGKLSAAYSFTDDEWDFSRV